MQDSIDPKSVNAHCLYHCVSTLLVLTRVALFKWIEFNGLGLLMSDNLAHCSILCETSIALVHLLDNSKLLTLRNALRAICQSCTLVVATQVIQLHML